MKAKSAISEDIDDIPLSAVAVKVTNIINPYYIRIYELENHALRANKISNKVQLLAQKKSFDEESDELLDLGDTLIVHNRYTDELPAWWCRGILGSVNNTGTKYNVFLPDYGMAFELAQSDFRKISKDAIPDEYLTTTIGLYDIVPASIVKSNKSKEETIIFMDEEWKESAIQCVKELVSAAEKIFFDPLAHDGNGKKYGELYLIIEDEIVTLRQALVLGFFAVHINDAFLSLIDKLDLKTSDSMKRINDSFLITEEDLNDSCKPKSKTKNSNVKNVDDYSTSTTTEAEEDTRNGEVHDPLEKKPRHRNLRKKEDQQILIRSDQKCHFIESVTDARFSAHIHKVLANQGVKRPRSIQSYMWPAVKKGFDVIAISPLGSGKSLGYLVPILSSLATEMKIKKGTAPMTLILCSSSMEVTNIALLCQEYLTQYPHINVVAAVNGKAEKSLVAEIYNGCQILVSTVPFLARFIKKFKNKNLMDLYQLRHIILDGADIILDKYLQPALEIFIKHKIMREKRDRYDNNLSLQVIAVAQQWTLGLRQFMDNSIVYPYVCIGSYMEAAAFSQVQPRLLIVRSQEKNKKILEVISELKDLITEKIMIICTDANDAINLNDFLILHKKKTLLAHSEMNFNDVHGIRQDWAASVSGMYPIIICTDDVLRDLDIKDITWLIHYSVNLSSKSRFYYRFSTLMDNWQSDKDKCKVLVMVDDSNDVQFQGLVEIMQRLHVSMPKSLLIAANEIAVTLDRRKKNYSICDNVKALGFCPKRTNCPYRHCVLKGIDEPVTNIRVGDMVKLRVTYIHNATHFSARLVQCFKKDEKEPIDYPSDQSLRLSTQMQKFYAITNNRRSCKEAKVGDICTMQSTIDHYERVKIMNIETKNHLDEPTSVTVRCIDNGRLMTKVSINELMHIPERLESWQTNIIEVFLSNIAPFDNEYEWDFCANKAAESWFNEFFDNRSYVVAKVNLHLGNTIWTDTLEIRSKLTGYPEFTVSSLRSFFMECNHGEINNNHLPMLYQLCKTAGINDFEFNNVPLEENDEVE